MADDPPPAADAAVEDAPLEFDDEADEEEHTELVAVAAPAPEAPRVEWDVWFDSRLPRGLTQEEYRSRLRNVGTVGNEADLSGDGVGYYHRFEFVPEDEGNKTKASRAGDPFRFNLRLFRKGVPPFWEDQPDGSGIHTFRFPTSVAPVNYQMFWKALTRSLLLGRLFNCEELVDEDTGANSPAFDFANVLGVCVHYGRNKGFGHVEIWCAGGGAAAEAVKHAVGHIIPQAKYGYEVVSSERDAMVKGNARVRAVAGKPTLRAAEPLSFTIQDSIERPLFKPYEKKTGGNVRRVWERPTGRVAGAGSGAQARKAQVEKKQVDEEELKRLARR
eukprot:TRINITY_DN4419_c1_g4_i2.p1 TRINITY_DN4419_c1_g4~~TRINITY_DN4419_c1_g4_i2.p1  ORF type:complete len:350 (+),score=138.05 TRINITY_DN4419_c1_g4_i2:60-1052(+)